MGSAQAVELLSGHQLRGLMPTDTTWELCFGRDITLVLFRVKIHKVLVSLPELLLAVQLLHVLPSLLLTFC
jgi:hypothetical protein